MFRAPKNLFHAYKLMCDSDLVKSKNPTPDALAEFEVYLNKAQPTTEDKTIFNMVRFFNDANAYGFSRMIQRNKAQSFILWTPPSEIAKWFQLTNIIHITYNGTRMAVNIHQSYVPRGETKKAKRSANKNISENLKKPSDLKILKSKPKLSAADFKKELEVLSVKKDILWCDLDEDDENPPVQDNEDIAALQSIVNKVNESDK